MGGLISYGNKTNVSADDIKKTGLYYLGTGCTPEYSILEVLVISSDKIWQRYTKDGGGPIKSRTYYNGKWFEWA